MAADELEYDSDLATSAAGTDSPHCSGTHSSDATSDSELSLGGAVPVMVDAEDGQE